MSERQFAFVFDQLVAHEATSYVYITINSTVSMEPNERPFRALSVIEPG